MNHLMELARREHDGRVPAGAITTAAFCACGKGSGGGVEAAACAELRLLRTLILDGLATDGAHHKQWYLEKISETLGFGDPAAYQERYNLERGVAP